MTTAWSADKGWHETDEEKQLILDDQGRVKWVRRAAEASTREGDGAPFSTEAQIRDDPIGFLLWD